ncbi:MAG TPA: hypothetical protein VK281_10020 [Xanthobacteraceae bacterium]|nr:hypothetical protein [Xanthobacteraceae bacterium]
MGRIVLAAKVSHVPSMLLLVFDTHWIAKRAHAGLGDAGPELHRHGAAPSPHLGRGLG